MSVNDVLLNENIRYPMNTYKMLMSVNVENV